MARENEAMSVNDLQARATANSIYPFLTDLGLVMILFGLFLVGNVLAVAGAVVLLVGLTGWYREAREEYRQLPD